MPKTPTEDQARYIEEVGALMADFGIPRMSGRILGWLLICDPPQQSLTQIADALHASKGTISTSMRLLVGASLVERRHKPRSRETFYQMAPGLWEKAFASKIGVITRMKDLAARGMTIVGDTPEAMGRLEEMHSLYVYVEREYAAMIEKYVQEREEEGPR